MTNKMKYNSGYLGNGITVWDTTKITNGDYKKVAHINPFKIVTFSVLKPTPELLTYIQNLLNSNPSVSETQPNQKVFHFDISTLDLVRSRINGHFAECSCCSDNFTKYEMQLMKFDELLICTNCANNDHDNDN